MSASGEALFHAEGDLLVPGDFARGPWSPDALHGGPVAAVAARAAEDCEADPAMQLCRLTLELLRPVPLAPLAVTATMLRPGRKLQVVDVIMAAAASGDVLARGRAVRVRTHAEGDLAGAGLPEAGAGGPVPGGEGAPAPPEKGEAGFAINDAYRAFHNAGAELRFVAGEFGAAGPSSVWVRLRVPVVAGEEPSPAQRAAAAADFGNGVSSVLDFAEYQFINPDLTIYLTRPPVDEWVCLEAVTRLGTPGAGLAESLLWDRRGPLGRSVQSLVVERRS